MDQKHQILKKYFGYDDFREGQKTLIDATLNGKDVLGIMPTGSGKSLCYQVPAILMDGITLVISPLISLMKDQVTALVNAGIPAAYINSSLTPAQIRTAYKRMSQGAYKIIYLAPERLQTYDFMAVAEQLQIAMIAVDEAHCISQWGQDFRPSYLKITEFLEGLPYRPVVSAFTATATKEVAEDIERALCLQNPVKLVTGFDRPNLRFEVRKPKNKLITLQAMIERRKDKSGIIYCSTRKDTESVCDALQSRGFKATKYHAGLPEEERHQNQDDFIYDRCPIMVATNAFGMGIDKSNVAYVIHYNMPKCIEAYYQEAGRAGRDGTSAECILLYSPRDVQTAKFLIQMPSENTELSTEQQELIRQQDLERLDCMIGYCNTQKCLRGYILSYFGQEHPESCGNCSSCVNDFVTQDVTKEANTVLRCLDRIPSQLGYGVGENLVIKTLRGSRVKRVLELQLDQMEAYGILKNMSEDQVTELLNALKEQGLIRVNHQYGTLEITAAGNVTMEEESTVTMRIRAAAEPAAVPAQPENTQAEESILTGLKMLRMKLALEEKVPAYIIFTNATLQDMAQKRPRTMDDFLMVSGVGSYKAERYGKIFLEEIKKLC